MCDAVRMFVVLLYLICAYRDSVWLLFVLGILQHSLASLSDPAFHAMVPQYVPPESLQYAHTIITTLWAIIVTIAYAVGGALIAEAGPVPNIIGDSLCYATSLALIGFLMYHIKALPDAFTPKIEGYLLEEMMRRSAASNAVGYDGGPLVGPLTEPNDHYESADATSFTLTDTNGQDMLTSFVEAVKYIGHEHYVLSLSVIRLLDALGAGAVSLITIKLIEEELRIAGSVPYTLGAVYIALGIAACALSLLFSIESTFY